MKGQSLWQSAKARYKHLHEQTALAATTTRRKIRGDFPQQRKYCSPVVILKFVLCCTRRLGSTMELWCPTQHSPCGPKWWNRLIHRELFLLMFPLLQFYSEEFSKEQRGTMDQAESHKADMSRSSSLKGWHPIWPGAGQPPPGSHFFIKW